MTGTLHQPSTVRQVGFTSRQVYEANIDALLAYAGVEPSGGGGLERKQAFIAAVDRIQAAPTPGRPFSSEPQVCFFEPGDELLEMLAREFTRAEDGTTVAPVRLPPKQRSAVVSGVSESVGLLQAFHPGYAAAVRDLVAAIVVAGGSNVSGATRSSQLATIYLNPPADWDSVSYAEALLHESVHIAHYLDQMITPWFASPHWQLAGPETSVISSIRRISRPLPLALEACCVSTVLVDLLWWAGADARAAAMCSSTMESLVGIKALERHLAPRGREIVEDLASVLASSPAAATARR
jgi:hypothetical protein